jgi:hypothetical protein
MASTPIQNPPKTFQPPNAGESVTVDGHTYLIGPLLGTGAFGAVFSCTRWRYWVL